MKKLIIIFGTFLIICMIVTHTAQQKLEDKVQQYNETITTQNGKETYTVKSENGKIVVYKGAELLYKTSTATSTLPKIDQKQLLYGIVATTEEEVQKILNDYCS